MARKFIMVTGPTHPTTNEWNGRPVPSFADQLSETVARLEAEGAQGITVDWKPLHRDGWHSALISYGGVERRTYTTREAATILGVSETTVKARVREGVLPRVPGVARHLIPADALAAFLGA